MVKVIMYATSYSGCMSQLVQSFERFWKNSGQGHELVILGLGSGWRGFGHRVHQVKEYVEQCNAEELLLCIDAYDVLLTGSLDDLESKFESLVRDNSIDDQKTVIISEEKFGFREALWQKYFVYGAIQNKHLTAGVYIGRTAAVKRLLTKVCDKANSRKRHFDDQVAFNQVGNIDLDLFYFDSDWNLFATYNGRICRDDVLSFHTNGTLMYKNKPVYVLHMPGGIDMSSNIKKLGYDIMDYKYRESYLQDVFWHGYQSYPIIRAMWLCAGAFIIVCLIYLLCRLKNAMMRKRII